LLTAWEKGSMLSLNKFMCYKIPNSKFQIPKSKRGIVYIEGFKYTSLGIWDLGFVA